MAERKIKSSFLIRHEDYEIIKPMLSFEEKGYLLNNLCEFSEVVSSPNETINDLKSYELPEVEGSPVFKMAFRIMSTRILQDTISYKEKCEKNKTSRTNAFQQTLTNVDERQQTLTNVDERQETSPIEKDKDRIEKDKDRIEKDYNNNKKRIETILGEKVAVAVAETNFIIESTKTLSALKELINKYGEEKVIDALDSADNNSSSTNNKRTIAYIKKTLENMITTRNNIEDWN